MDIKSLKPAGEFAKQFGLKAIIYGSPGSSKTPLINTCSRPVMLACEPGMLSMRNSKVPCFEAYTAKAVDEFFAWFFNSAEVKNFDTLAIDSTSQLADIYLQDAKKTIKHGLQQYGIMAENTMNHLRRLYFFQNMNTYLIAKEEIKTINDIHMKRPFYPGQQLNIDVPHLYDAIIRVGKVPVPGVGETLAFQCQASYNVLARERTGRASEFEEPNFAKLVTKVTS